MDYKSFNNNILRSRAASDQERLEALIRRLADIETRSVPSWQRPIQEVARLALQEEISSLGRRVARSSALVNQAPSA